MTSNWAVIPKNFDDLPIAVRNRTIPICVPRRDDEGVEIDAVWIEGAERAYDYLIYLSGYYLREQWRASELADWAVRFHARLHTGQVTDPKVAASYIARSCLSYAMRNSYLWNSHWHSCDVTSMPWKLVDGLNCEEYYNVTSDLAALRKRLSVSGGSEAADILDMIIEGMTWKEIGKATARKPNTACQFFRRLMKSDPILNSGR